MLLLTIVMVVRLVVMIIFVGTSGEGAAIIRDLLESVLNRI